MFHLLLLVVASPVSQEAGPLGRRELLDELCFTWPGSTGARSDTTDDAYRIRQYVPAW